MYPGGGVEHFTGSLQVAPVEPALAVGAGDRDPADSEGPAVPQAHANTIERTTTVRHITGRPTSHPMTLWNQDGRENHLALLKRNR